MDWLLVLSGSHRSLDFKSIDAEAVDLIYKYDLHFANVNSFRM